MSDVKFNVDGKDISARKGMTVMEACEENDIDIPKLCQHEALENLMACRLCVVEVNGKQITPSCGLKVNEGLDIKTQTEKLRKYRRMILELIYRCENHYCMFCESDGDCELQDLMYEYEIDRFEYPRMFPDWDVDSSHNHIVKDTNRCVRCGRCIRACDEVVGNQTLNLGGRGITNEVIVDSGVPLGESTCTSCGMCMQVCPTGSLSNKHSLFKGNKDECELTKSTCLSCSIGCCTDVYTRTGHLVKIEGTDIDKESGGQLCERGRFKPLVDRGKRISNVIYRENGEESELSLQEGLEKAASILGNSNEISAFASGGLTCEILDAFSKAMRAHGALFDVVGAKRYRFETEVKRRINMIEGHFINDITEVMKAENILLYDTSIYNTHPVLASYIRRAASKGTKLITIDAYEDRFWNHSDKSITIESPKTQLTRLVNQVIKEGKASIEDLSRVSSILGGLRVHPEDVMEIVNLLEEASYDIIVIGCEIIDRWSLRHIFELAKLEGSYVISLNKASNQYIRSLETEGVYEEPEVAYILAGEDEENEDMIKLVENAEFSIVQSSKKSELTDKADLVIPSLSTFERNGTTIDINGKKKEVELAMEPKGEMRSEIAFFEELADKR